MYSERLISDPRPPGSGSLDCGILERGAAAPRSRVLTFGADALARPCALEPTPAGEAVAHLGVDVPVEYGFLVAHGGRLLRPKRHTSEKQPS